MSWATIALAGNALAGTVLATDDGDQILDDPLTSVDWVQASLIIVGSIVLAVIISKILRKAIAHGIGPGFAAIILARLTSYVVFLIGLSYALTTLGVRVGPLLGALGLGGLVLALALQKLVENFVASIILQARRPFTMGDAVILDEYTGIVSDIDSRTTLLRGLDGSHVRIPNSTVVSSTIVNLTREPVRRSSMLVGVAYDSNLEAATDALRAAIDRVPRVLRKPPPSINLTSFSSSSIDFNILYWHRSDIPSELAARHDLMIAVHHALIDDNITIAFPQVVVWDGGDSVSDPYAHPPREIQSAYPAVDETSSSRKRIKPQLRRAVRRRNRSDEGDSSESD